MAATSEPPVWTAEPRLRRAVTWSETVSFGMLLWGVACLLPLGASGAAWWASRFLLLGVLVWAPLALGLIEHPEGRAVSPLAILVRRSAAVLPNTGLDRSSRCTYRQ